MAFIFRHRARAALLLLCATAILMGPAMAQDKPVMTWLVLDLPPAMILVEGKPVDGIAAQRLKFIMAQMPDMQHEFRPMPAARIVATLSQSDAKGCFNNAIITPEREKRFYLSATNMSYPFSIVAKPETLKKLSKNPAGEVLPAALFDRTDLTGVISLGRSYTALYDTLMARRNPKVELRSVPPIRSGTNLLQMVELGRADYTIEYEYTMSYLMETEPELKNAHLQALPLAGSLLNKSGVMCPHNAWGFEAIKKIDSIITKLLPDPAFQNQKNRWTSPQMSAHLKPQIDAFYAERMHTPSVFTPP